MSLSFVKSAVLSSTDGVSHNEETAIDSKETQSLRASGGGGGAHRPLFDQLRANKEAEQERYDEMQRAMRGAATLDEEDCAHLDAVERMREEKERAARSGVEREVALFRAAREDRGLVQTVAEGGEGEDGDGAEGGGDENAPTKPKAQKEAKKIVPKFTIKKKRKRAPQESDSNGADDSSKKVAAEQSEGNAHDGNGEKKNGGGGGDTDAKKAANDDGSDSDNAGGGLLGLGCYGSDSD